MKLHNTRTKSTDEFRPLSGQTARVYSCGPTVYNHAHIGNLSTYIHSDILNRVLRLAGFDVQHVMNFTDVDDKTIRDSATQFPDQSPMAALTRFTRHWEKLFRADMLAIGNDLASIHFERATENIDGIQALTRKLLQQQIAYLSEDGIYFDIKKYQRKRVYGQLSPVELDERRARINNDEYDKDAAQDFALWKVEKPDEPAWDFWVGDDGGQTLLGQPGLAPNRQAVDAEAQRGGDGLAEQTFDANHQQNLRGRPGWHIECSVMSVKGLGQPFDIHTGGVDLIFPHHENEIAQSTAGDQPELYANFFVHSEHLLVNGAKMAKSAHNFYTLPDLEKKGFDPLDFRMLVLQSHYRSATNFSWENLAAAGKRRRNWRNLAELRHQTADSGDDGQVKVVKDLLDQAAASLLSDLDTPNALKYLDEAVSVLAADQTSLSHSALENFIKFVDKNLGLNLGHTTPDITPAQRALIKSRDQARAAKNWAKSDEIRHQLAEQGIELNDTASQTIWSRK